VRAESAGVSALTNQSETNAAPMLETPSATITSEIDQDATVPAGSSLLLASALDAAVAGSSGSRRIDAGSERAKTTSNTTAATLERAPS
jgi:hypothetical protein